MSNIPKIIDLILCEVLEREEYTDEVRAIYNVVMEVSCQIASLMAQIREQERERNRRWQVITAKFAHTSERKRPPG